MAISALPSLLPLLLDLCFLCSALPLLSCPIHSTAALPSVHTMSAFDIIPSPSQHRFLRIPRQTASRLSRFLCRFRRLAAEAETEARLTAASEAAAPTRADAERAAAEG